MPDHRVLPFDERKARHEGPDPMVALTAALAERDRYREALVEIRDEANNRLDEAIREERQDDPATQPEDVSIGLSGRWLVMIANGALNDA